MIEYTAGYKYVLRTQALFRLPASFANCAFAADWGKLENGVLIIYSRYAWDGPSGPAMDTKNAIRASLLHDALYQAIREELLPITLRDAADRQLKSIAISDGMTNLRAHGWYLALKAFGKKAATQNKNILIAP